MNIRVKQLVFTALFTAIIYVATASIKIPVPFTSGYIHPGDSMIFIASALLSTPYAMLAAGVGSMLADLLSPYANWALPTFIIKSLMALIICFTIKSSSNKKITYLFGIIGSLTWVSFASIITIVLNKTINSNATYLLSELEDITSMDQLLSSSNSLMYQLVFFAVIIPIFIVILLFIITKKNNANLSLSTIIGMTLAGLLMIIGYYFAAVIMYGSFISPIFSIPWNMVQFVIGFFIALLLLPVVKKAYIYGSK